MRLLELAAKIGRIDHRLLLHKPPPLLLLHLLLSRIGVLLSHLLALAHLLTIVLGFLLLIIGNILVLASVMS